MAHQRIEGSGVWSCRIKISQPQQDSSKAAADSNLVKQQQQQQQKAASKTGMIGPPTTNGSRRIDRMAEALQSMADLNNSMEFDSPIDPDAQATVTDFLDFTEYLPADMKRSYTLVSNLDLAESKARQDIHELTRMWGNPQDASEDSKPDLVELRASISQKMGDAVRIRTLAHTECQRMSHSVLQHHQRAVNILAKLEHMQENYPPTPVASPPQKSVSPMATRNPVIKLRLDGEQNGARVRKHRAPRITVPGEVLAPYELEYESYGSESESETSDIEEARPSRRRTPGQSVASSNGTSKIVLKISKQRNRSEKPKPPRQPRPPGAMGTNVHSAVAGISTTNALAMLRPPPPDAKKGSADLPWLQLTDWELGMLRKRMKKNAVWSPSDTMIARELKELGRGIEAYRTAKKEAEESGQSLDGPVPPQLLGQTVHAEGAISVEALRANQDVFLKRGMAFNEAKKLKREANKTSAENAKIADIPKIPDTPKAPDPPKNPDITKTSDTAKGSEAPKTSDAHEAAQNFLRKMDNRKLSMKDLLSNDGKGKNVVKTPAKTPARKRKRDSVAPGEAIEKSVEEGSVSTPTEVGERPAAPKRTKTETPIPVPQSLITSRESKAATPSSTVATPTGDAASVISTDTAPLSATETSYENSAILPQLSPVKVSAPILPPTKNLRRDAKKDNQKDALIPDAQTDSKKPETPGNTRPSRSSAVAKLPFTPAPVADSLPAKRPSSSRNKTPSSEPPALGSTATAANDRPQRSSTARNTPAPVAPIIVPESRQTNKRARRPAPGVVTAGSEGSASVTVGKRSLATRKKAGAKKERKDGREGSAVQDVYEEYDDAGNLIDPDEPRYCVCNRVSFGLMIGCENAECEKEWFHLECVGLTEVPPRTTKWYCPECRKKLNLGERGEVTARGRKK